MNDKLLFTGNDIAFVYTTARAHEQHNSICTGELFRDAMIRAKDLDNNLKWNDA